MKLDFRVSEAGTWAAVGIRGQYDIDRDEDDWYYVFYGDFSDDNENGELGEYQYLEQAKEACQAVEDTFDKETPKSAAEEQENAMLR